MGRLPPYGDRGRSAYSADSFGGAFASKSFLPESLSCARVRSVGSRVFLTRFLKNLSEGAGYVPRSLKSVKASSQKRENRPNRAQESPGGFVKRTSPIAMRARTLHAIRRRKPCRVARSTGAEGLGGSFLPAPPPSAPCFLSRGRARPFRASSRSESGISGRPKKFRPNVDGPSPNTRKTRSALAIGPRADLATRVLPLCSMRESVRAGRHALPSFSTGTLCPVELASRVGRGPPLGIRFRGVHWDADVDRAEFSAQSSFG